MNHKLFIYGTLKDSEVQKRILGREVVGESDVLQGYKKTTIELDSVKYPIIIEDVLSSVRGKVIEVSDEELSKIDNYESGRYQRIQVMLESGIEAWVYKAA